MSTFRRFLSKVSFPPTGCWEWRGAKDRLGYSQLWIEGRMAKAHRYAYSVLRERIPSGLTLDHLCRNRGCVNPYHLEAVTQQVNVLRGEGVAAKHARQTHCKRGHPFDLLNTIRTKIGRSCRACQNAHNRAYRERRSAPCLPS